MQNSDQGSQVKRPQYSQSEINMFLKCGKSWEFRYLQNLKTPPSGSMSLGSSVDAAISTNLVQRIDNETDLPIEQILEVYSKDFDVREKESEWGDEVPGEQKDVGVSLIRMHYEQVTPNLNPLTVQEKFILEMDAGYDLTGTIDLTEKNDVVSDLKTSGKKYDEVEKLGSVQATLYDFAFEALHKRKAKEFRYDVLIKTKVPKVQQIAMHITENHRAHMFDAINNMHKAIQSGIALPAPEGAWWCGPKWCGYWNICKGKK